MENYTISRGENVEKLQLGAGGEVCTYTVFADIYAATLGKPEESCPIVAKIEHWSNGDVNNFTVHYWVRGHEDSRHSSLEEAEAAVRATFAPLNFQQMDALLRRAGYEPPRD